MTLRSWISLLILVSLGLRTALAQDHTYSSADIAAGLRLYAAQCVLCHGPNGDMVNGIDLRQGRFRRALTDADLESALRTGSPAGMPAFTLSEAETRAVIAMIRAGFDPAGTAVRVGSVDGGRAAFSNRGCATCHRVNGVGPRTAPDLSDIGLARTPAALQRSLLDPTAAMLPINRPTRIITTDGRTIRGRRVNEDTFSVQLIDEQERLVTVLRREIKETELSRTSPMASIAAALSPAEVADLVAYLLSLRGAS